MSKEQGSSRYIPCANPENTVRAGRRRWESQQRFFCYQHISQMAIRTSLEKQLDPMGPIASRVVSVLEFLRKPTANCDFPGVGGTDPLSPSRSAYVFRLKLVPINTRKWVTICSPAKWKNMHTLVFFQIFGAVFASKGYPFKNILEWFWTNSSPRLYSGWDADRY